MMIKRDKNSMRVISNLKITQSAAAVGAGIGSMFPVYLASYNAAFNYTSIMWLSVLIAIATVLLALFIIEYGMHTYLPFGLKGLLSGEAFKNWRSTLLYLTITGLSVGFMFSSGWLSFEGRKDGAKLVAGKIETKDADQVALNISRLEEKRLNEVKRSIMDLSIQARKRDSLLRRANSKLVSLANSGNNWASNQLETLLKKDQELSDLKQGIVKAETTKSEILKQSAVFETVSSINKENTTLIEERSQTVETAKGLIGYFGIFSVIVFAIASFIISLYEVENESIKRVSAPHEYETVKGGVDLIRKAETALKQAFENRDEIQALKQVSEISKGGSTPEISETKPKRKKKKYTPETFEIVSKGDTVAVWVPGFKTEPFSLSQLKSKLSQAEWKLTNGVGKKSTNEANIEKFTQAIEFISKQAKASA